MRAAGKFIRTSVFGAALITTRVVSAEADTSKPAKNTAGLDCKHTACKGRMDLMQKAFHSARTQQQQSESQSQSQPDQMMTVSPKKDVNVKECPVNKDDLGEGTWALLHTLAAHFPDNPSTDDQEMILQLYNSLARFYPCPICAADFQQSIMTTPPEAQSREALVLWTCRLHNEVNAKLGRQSFACSVQELDRRWLDGGDKCDTTE